MDKPIAYKFGGAHFCELPFFVNRHVLIPRFDTEILVETAVKHTKVGGRVLDLCTGSGCVAVVLAKHDFRVTASDASRKALHVAKRNAKLHGVGIEFVRSNLFEKISPFFNAITCNPPYIKTREIGKHDASIFHEPRIALDGGHDGLEFYRKIIARAPKYLADGGKIFLEISHEQSADVKTILQHGGFCDIEIVKDQRGLSRVIHGRKI